MAAPRSRKLVVDASVLRAAGSQGATHPVSVQSRQLLLDVLDVCHQVVLSRDLMEEWRNHHSNFSRKWLVQMYSRRKVSMKLERNCAHLRRAVIRSQELDRYQRQAAEKDFLLIEAALNGDMIIISLDDRARDLYCLLGMKIKEFGDIFWINPVNEFSATFRVLRDAEPLKAAWKLDPTRGV